MRRKKEEVLLHNHTQTHTCMHADIQSKPQHTHTHTLENEMANGGVTSGDVDGVKEQHLLHICCQRKCVSVCEVDSGNG